MQQQIFISTKIDFHPFSDLPFPNRIKMGLSLYLGWFVNPFGITVIFRHPHSNCHIFSFYFGITSTPETQPTVSTNHIAGNNEHLSTYLRKTFHSQALFLRQKRKTAQLGRAIETPKATQGVKLFVQSIIHELITLNPSHWGLGKYYTVTTEQKEHPQEITAAA